jgi:hypothetical protein
MGCFAAISMQVDLSRRSSAADVARDVLETFPGSRNAALDAGSGAASLEVQFPGNLSALAARMRSLMVPISGNVKMRVPIFNVAEARADVDTIRKTMEEGPEIWDVQFVRDHYVEGASVDGDWVEATIVPSTNAVHHIYDALMRIGLLAAAKAPGFRGL